MNHLTPRLERIRENRELAKRGQRRCLACGTVKILAEFYGGGTDSSCKPCHNAAGRRRYREKAASIPPRSPQAARIRENRDLAQQGRRRCLACREIKPLGDFCITHRKPNTQYDSRCRPCRNLRVSELTRAARAAAPPQSELAARRRENRTLGRQGVKRCRTCGSVLPLSDFGKASIKDGWVGYQSSCRSCEAPKLRSRTIRRRYGISDERYAQLLEAQSGVCAVCSGSSTRRGKSISLSVDHNHSTGRIRGLLCSLCNTGIGLLDDDPTTLGKMLAYLADPPAPKVLKGLDQSL